jgi:hypothetical protein
MKMIAITILSIATLPSQASARSDTDYPHRDWGQVVTLDMSVTDATACIMRELGRRADATVIPMDGGNDIDIAAHLAWGKKMEPWQTYKIRGDGGVTTMRAFYRHPVTQAGVSKEVGKLQEHCLKVKAISPG